MDANKERYFYLSGLISVSFFILLIFIVGYSLLLSPKIEQFAMIKSDVINVSIAISEAKTNEQSAPQVSKPSEETTPIKKEETPTKSEKIPDISDLFSEVKLQKTAKPAQENTKNQEQLNKLEKEILNKKDTPRFSDKVDQVNLIKPSVKMIVQGGSTGPIVNEYHAKIQGLVYTYFQPPSGTAGQVARVRMSISASGKLIGYKVLRYSGNEEFNTEIDWLKDRLSSVRFPENPEGKDAILDFILTAKE